MKINRTIVRELLTLNQQICVLINRIQEHSTPEDAIKLKDLELKMKWHAKHHPEEWNLFQKRNPDTNEIDGISINQI